MVGAIYLDRGYKYSKIFIIDILLKKHVNMQELKDTDDNFKSKLIEYIQSKKLELEYKTDQLKRNNVSTRKFEAIVLINGEEKGKGIGFSKKEAEQNASQDCLNNI